MDQSAAIRCRAGHALFLDCRAEPVEQIPFDLDGAGLAMLVIDSRAPHRHVDGEYAARRAACERAAAAARGAGAARRDVADLDAALARLADDGDPPTGPARGHREPAGARHGRAAARRPGARASAPLLTASHASMRDDFEITVPEVDTAVEAALRRRRATAPG